MALFLTTPSQKFAAHMPHSTEHNAAPRIGLLNLMPNKEETEQQWFELIAPGALQVNLQLLKLTSYTPKNTPTDYLERYYFPATFSTLESLDGLIITGAPLGQKNLADIHYLAELKSVIELLAQRNTPVFYSCWAANVALHLQYGIEITRMPRKLSGVFEHHSAAGNLMLPHSRYGQLNLLALRSHIELKIELDSAQAGPTLITQRNGTYYLLGHPEYSADTLWKEYLRDQNNGLNPVLPVNVEADFSNAAQLTEFTREWRQFGIQIMNNWLSGISS